MQSCRLKPACEGLTQGETVNDWRACTLTRPVLLLMRWLLCSQAQAHCGSRAESAAVKQPGQAAVLSSQVCLPGSHLRQQTSPVADAACERTSKLLKVHATLDMFSNAAAAAADAAAAAADAA